VGVAFTHSSVLISTLALFAPVPVGVYLVKNDPNGRSNGYPKREVLECDPQGHSYADSDGQSAA